MVFFFLPPLKTLSASLGQCNHWFRGHFAPVGWPWRPGGWPLRLMAFPSYGTLHSCCHCPGQPQSYWLGLQLHGALPLLGRGPHTEAVPPHLHALGTSLLEIFALPSVNVSNLAAATAKIIYLDLTDAPPPQKWRPNSLTSSGLVSGRTSPQLASHPH
jgi:hypothetical protein